MLLTTTTLYFQLILIGILIGFIISFLMWFQANIRLFEKFVYHRKRDKLLTKAVHEAGLDVFDIPFEEDYHTEESIASRGVAIRRDLKPLKPDKKSSIESSESEPKQGKKERRYNYKAATDGSWDVECKPVK